MGSPSHAPTLQILHRIFKVGTRPNDLPTEGRQLYPARELQCPSWTSFMIMFAEVFLAQGGST
jgi:hypothetical protein